MSSSTTAKADTPVDAYLAMALQTTCFAVSTINNPADARRRMSETIDRIAAQISSSKGFVGRDCRLVVLPEYFLTGFPMGDPIEAWKEKACLDIDGPEFDSLAQIASKNDIYLAGNAYENDPNFPDLYFQTCFVMAPSGECVLRYRRLNSMFAPTPHDVWDAYLDKYGLEGVFPVAKTDIGNLAAIASEEILYPEIARCHAVRGAEVFLHPTSQVNELVRAPKDIVTAARAIENLAYVVSANSAGIEGTPLPGGSADGGSKIVDFKGLELVRTGTGESMSAYSEIDLNALRRYRRRPGMENLLSRQRFELYAETYQMNCFYPAGTMKGTKPERQQFVQNQMQTIERLSKLGII